MSKDDEYFRLAVSSLIGRSEHGDRIWNENVLPSTLSGRRIGPLIDDLAEQSRPTILKTLFGTISATAMPVRADEIDRVLIRITKGFLSHTHPEIDSSQLSYEITMVEQFKAVQVVRAMKNLKYCELGDGIFRMWRGLAEVDTRIGIWVYMFYNSATFGVQHRPK